MAAVLSFTTTPILSGHSIRVYSTSTDWNLFNPADSTSATLTIKTLDDDKIFVGGVNTITKSIDLADLVGDFQIDLTALELFGVDQIVPDDIITFTLDIVGTSSYTYSTDEVFYYNAWAIKTEKCYDAVNFILDIHSSEIKYACLINILYQGLIADIAVANTSGIYEKIDIFNRLNQ